MKKIIYHYKRCPKQQKVNWIVKKNFAPIAFNQKHQGLVVYIIVLGIDLTDEIYPSRKTDIAQFESDEVLVQVSSNLSDFKDVFFTKFGGRIPQAEGD